MSLYNCLHGLMLPSGNDAATVIAEELGDILYYESREYLRSCEAGKPAKCT